MDDQIILLLAAIFGTSGFWEFVRRRSNKKDDNRDLLIGLAHDKIHYLCNKAMESGHIDDDEFDNLYNYIYIPYKARGGNGTAEIKMNKVIEIYTNQKKGR